MDLSNILVDVDAERDGVWHEIDSETSVRVARWQNPKHRDMQIEHSAKAREYGAVVTDEMVESQLNQQLAECILLDWKGMKEGGVVLPFSKENALRIFGDPKLHDFRDLVLNLSQNARLFRENRKKVQLGN